jgi:predicted ATP-grasp superfamily ATP-dependent carboligase
VSSAVRRTYLYRSFRPVSSIDAAIEAADPDLVVPCDDLATAHLHAIYERESRYGSSPGSETAALLVRSLGSPANYSIIDSRQEFLALACEEGVLVPNSALTPELSALDGWILENGVPAVLKTDCTSGGEGVRIVETRQQARRAFRELVSRRPTAQTFKRMLMDGDTTSVARLLQSERPLVSVQQFVAGQDANLALACWQGEVLAQILAIVLKTRSPRGPAAVIRLIENSQMSAAVKTIVRRLGLSGFAGFDFVIEERTGKAFLIEINPRATQTCHLQLGVRRNLTAALCASVSGSPMAKSPSVTGRHTIVLWPHVSESLLPANLVERAYFDTPRHDPEVVRLYGSSKRLTLSNAMKSLKGIVWKKGQVKIAE